MRALLAGCAFTAIATLAMACDDSRGTGAEPSVSGSVFNDRERNGARDKGEPGVEGWTLLMCMGDMCQSATTGGAGRFHFDGVPPGRYNIGLVDVPVGWQRAFQDCGVGTVTLGEGEHKTVDMAVRFVGTTVSGFGGSVWKDGAPLPEGTGIEALVEEKVCGETTTCGLRESTYFMWVVSAEQEEGCGEDGTEVRFRLGGAMANQTAQWQDQDSASVDLFVGPDLAVFEGLVLAYRPDTPSIMIPEGAPVNAYVGERLCGESTIFVAHPGPNRYQIVVLADALQAGCGSEGALITFALDGQPANEGAQWQPGVHHLELTVGEPPPPTPSPTRRPSPSPSPTQRPGKITPTPTATAPPTRSATPGP